MGEITDQVSETIEKSGEDGNSGFNSVIAASVAIIATLMALGNIKDGNIVQAMAQAQSKGVDTWAYFQAKSTKQHVVSTAGEQLKLQRAMNPALPSEARALLEEKIAFYEAQSKKYEAEKAEIKKEAEGYQQEYDRLNVHDDQFDLSEAGLSISIALFGVSALTRKRWLLGIAFGFALFGVLFTFAGFFGWSLRPQLLAKFLG